MSLSYQGNLRRRTFRSPSTAFRFGESQFAEHTHHRRVDVRFAWDRPETIEAAAEYLPATFRGYWFDIAAEASPAAISDYAKWVEVDDGGRVGLVSLVPNRGAEVTIEVPGPSHQRLDHDQLNPHRPHIHSHQVRVRYREHVSIRSNSKARVALAAARTRAAYQEIAKFRSEDGEAFEDWLFARNPKAELPREGEAKVRRTDWFTAPAGLPSPIEFDDVYLKPIFEGNTLAGLQITLPGTHRAVGVALWRRWLSLLDQVEVVLRRQIGVRADIGSALNQLELDQQHPDQPHQLFGITTVHEPEELAIESIDAIVNAPRLTERLADWDLRWTDLRLRLDGELDRPDEVSCSHYVVRTERERTVDRLLFSLAVDDPQDIAFRAARRQLKALFGPELGQESAWQFDGVPEDSPRGRRYQRLRGVLKAELDAAGAELAPLPSSTASALNRMTEWVAAHTKSARNREQSIVDVFGAAIAEQLPGFRYDRRAHITDKYYLDFVRRTPGGFHFIQIERRHGPARHRVSLGSGLINIPLSDLTPSAGFSVPGINFDLEVLLPDHPGEWTYATRGGANRAVADTVAILAARVEPFFERAEAQLLAARRGEFDEESP